MFDNPKKELERLEQQLLASERNEPDEDPAELFPEEVSQPVLDSDRYVPAVPKGGIGGLATLALVLAISVIALTLWALGRLL